MKYFATVPLVDDPPLAVSIFVAGFEELLEVRGRLGSLGALAAEVHDSLRGRGSQTKYGSELRERGLVLLPPSNDWTVEETGERRPRAGHKIGGRPHLVSGGEALREAVERFLAQGFSLICQFDFPASSDAEVAGDWPFGDGIMMLLGRPPYGEQDFVWYWDL